MSAARAFPQESAPALISIEDLRDIAAPDFRLAGFCVLWDWAVIASVIAIASLWHNLWLDLCAIVVVGGRQHALFILVHEGVHKHLARGKALNDWVSNWLAAYPIGFDTQAYRLSHLKHHEHLNTDQDPDWVRKKKRQDWQFPVERWKAALFLPYFVCLFGALEWAYMMVMFSGVLNKRTYAQKNLRQSLLHKTLFYALVIGTVMSLEMIELVLVYWLVPLFFVFPLLQRIRSVSEHFGLRWTSDLNSSRDVKSRWFEQVFFAPHGVNYHLTHHLFPGVPGYRLQALHNKLCERQIFRDGAHINSSYIGLIGNSVLRDVTKT